MKQKTLREHPDYEQIKAISEAICEAGEILIQDENGTRVLTCDEILALQDAWERQFMDELFESEVEGWDELDYERGKGNEQCEW